MDTLDTLIAEMTSIMKRVHKLGGDERASQIMAAAGGFIGSMNTSRPRTTTLLGEYSAPKERGYRSGTVIADVHEFVKDNADLTLKEIVVKFQEINPFVPEKTIRTSLLRLRDKWGGMVIEENGKWRSK